MENDSGTSSDSHTEEESVADPQMEAPSHSPNHEREKPRGRPVGKPDSTKRYRRTAQEISDDKIKVQQMRLDAMKEAEALKMSNKKPRRPPTVIVSREEEPLATKRGPSDGDAEPKKVSLPSSMAIPRRGEDSSPSPRRPAQFRRQSLYDFWFPPSPRTMR